MQLLGISSYPVRRRQILWTAILLGIIVALGRYGRLFSDLLLWLSRNENTKFYFTGLLPLPIWGTLVLALVWIFLIVLMWQTVVRTFKEYFPVNKDKEIYPIRNINKYLFFFLVGISFVYLILQFKSYLVIRETVLIGDSWSYLQGASLNLNDPAFFSDRRPWGILFIYKILGSSQTTIEIFQLSISTIAWLWLAWVFVRSIKNDWVKLLGFIVTLSFSLSPTVQVWNHAVLSESLSISFMIFILAVFIQLSQQWKWWYLVWLTLLFVFWMSFREANAYIALFVAFAFLIMGFIQRTLRIYWLMSFVIGITFWINYQLSSATVLPRWALPLAEVITHRILPDQEFLEYFSNNGMPVTPELMALSGRNAISDNFAVVNNIKLKRFSKWLFNDARNVYVKFLLAHPVYTIISPFVNIETLLGYDYFEGVPIPDYVPALPKLVNEMFYPTEWFWVYWWLSLFAVGFIATINLHTGRRIYWITLIFLLLAIPQLYLVWHGDALDVERHAVVMNIQVHLGLWWLMIIYIDEFLEARLKENSGDLLLDRIT